MLMGTDPLFHQGLLNVPGGPIVDIARLSSFRGDLADKPAISRPSLLNGGPGLDGFTEDLPLRVDPPEVITHPGAAALQELFANTNWYDRKGSPETFAPRIRLRPDPAWTSNPKNFVFQVAYGDGTVTDVAGGAIVRAGALVDRVGRRTNPPIARIPAWSSSRAARRSPRACWSGFGTSPRRSACESRSASSYRQRRPRRSESVPETASISLAVLVVAQWSPSGSR